MKFLKATRSLKAFILLANASVDYGQSISVLAAVSNGMNLTPNASTSEYLDTVQYEKLVSVCETTQPK